MKVIITKKFQKQFLRPLKKYFGINDFVENLKKKEHTFISINSHFFKFKNKIKGVAFRGVLVFIKDNKIIPLCIFLKKNKKYGENLSWEIYEKMIEEEFNESIKDIENGDFNVW